MEIEDGSDDENPRSSSKQAGASKDDGTDSMQEQAIDENQMINEEYKIWLVFPVESF